MGRRFAYFISVFSVAVSLAGDLSRGSHYSGPLVPFLNASIVLAFYLVVIWLPTRLRSRYTELKARVQPRTAALTDEMAERERLEGELLEISEREQRRIGHDLHDSLGQNLTGAALAVQVLEDKSTACGLPEAADAKNAVELVEEGVALARRLAKALHPTEMEAEALLQVLEESPVTTSELFKVSCRFECDSPTLVHTAATFTHLYRIAQEAIANVLKHGKANNIGISLETLDDGIPLQVQDDGVGFPDALPRNAGGGPAIYASSGQYDWRGVQSPA